MNIVITEYRKDAVAFQLHDENDTIVGICSIEAPSSQHSSSLPLPYHYAYFYGFVVMMPHRGKGYGKLLFERMLRYCKDQGWYGVYWYTDEYYVDLTLPHHNLYNQYAVKIDDSTEWYVEF